MKRVTYNYRGYNGDHTSENFIVNVNEIQGIQPCHNKCSSKIFFKNNSDSMSVSVPFEKLLKLLDLD